MRTSSRLTNGATARVSLRGLMSPTKLARRRQMVMATLRVIECMRISPSCLRSSLT